MMNMTDPVAISVETQDRYWVLFREIVRWINPYKSLNDIIPNYQSS